jgi:hypothetical protein
MAPRLEAPSPYTWEFGKRLGLDQKSLESQKVGGRDAAARRVHWPARVAVIRVEKETSYMPISQGEWDETLRRSSVVESVSVLDGIGVEKLPSLKRKPSQRSSSKDGKANRSRSTEDETALFTAERWFAQAANSDLIFLYATQVSTDTYWNPWVFTYMSVVGIPFAPAQEQAARAVSKGFLVDVKTGEVLETAGAIASRERSTNPVFVMEPLHELEQQVVHEAELELVQQLAKKVEELHARTRPARTK